MEDLDKYLNFALDAAKIVAPFAGPALGISVAAPVLLGVRFGPGRAFVLVFKSYFQRSANPISVRTSIVVEINEAMLRARTNKFSIVSGPKGVGKTVAVATAFRGQMGVVHVTISAGDSAKRIVEKALGAVANIPTRSNTFTSANSSGQRFIYWYQLMFSKSPLVIFNIQERSPHDPHAELAAAARMLTYDHQLRVLVDASDNTLPDELFATMRGLTIAVDKMDQETAESIPEFKVFITSLREADLADLVYHIIGGVPANYELMMMKTEGLSGGELFEAVNLFLGQLQTKAINLKDDVLRFHPTMSELHGLFKIYEEIPTTHDKVKKVTRPSPDKTM